MVRQDHGQALSQLAWSVGDGWKRRRVIGCCRGAGTCSPQPTLHGPALSWARASRTTSTLRVSVSDAPCLPCASHGASTRQPFGRHACPDFEGLWPLPHPPPKIDWSPRLNHTALVWLRADWFCALGGQGPCLFAHPTSGLLHFSRTHFNGSDWIAQPRPGANRSACTCVRRRAPTPAAPGALSLAGKQFRQACQAVSSGSQLSQSALATAHASIAGEWVPGAAQTVERLSAYRCSHRPHAPPTVHPAVPLPPNACLTGRPSVSGGVCDGHHPWSVAASSIARWWASRTAGRCTGASVMWGASPSAAPLAPPAASRPASRCHPRRCGATPGSTPGRSLTKVSNASHLN
jgi:hypothetical protein